MKNINNLLLFFLVNSFYSTQEELIDGVIAKVNDKPILYSDIQNIIIAMKYDKNKIYNNKKKEVEILNELIEQNLVISSNQTISLEKEEKMIKDGVTEQTYDIFDKYFHNDEENFIKEFGCNIEDYIKIGIENQKKQMLYFRIIDEFFKKETFSYEKIKNFYKHLKKQNKLPQVDEYFEIYEIQLSQKDSKSTYEKAKNIRNRLKQENWNDVLKSLSNDEGISSNIDEKWHILGDLEEEFEYEVFKLKIGEISNVVKINDGYYIIKLLDIDKTKYKTAIIFLSNNIYSSNEKEAFEDLKKIKQDILSKKVSWEQAVIKYSQNKQINKNGQIFSKNFNGKLKKNNISREIRNILKNIKEGEISDPFIEKNNDNTLFKIIYLKKHIKKHFANLKDDFILIEKLAKKAYNDKKRKKIIDNLYKNAIIKINKHYKVGTEWLKIYKKRYINNCI